MTDDEALLTRCLHALEDSIDAVRSEYENDWRHGIPSRRPQLRAMYASITLHEQTIKDLKARLGS